MQRLIEQNRIGTIKEWSIALEGIRYGTHSHSMTFTFLIVDIAEPCFVVEFETHLCEIETTRVFLVVICIPHKTLLFGIPSFTMSQYGIFAFGNRMPKSVYNRSYHIVALALSITVGYYTLVSGIKVCDESYHTRSGWLVPAINRFAQRTSARFLSHKAVGSPYVNRLCV